jgi:RNA polymerase sigma factor (sigma-70 family)
MDKELATNLETLHPDAFGWALHCCGGEVSRAEDVLQNAYLKVAQERVSFEGRATFKTWWFGVIRFTAHEEHRRVRFRESLLGRLFSTFTEDTHPPPSRNLEFNERNAELRAALAQLPARQAEVLHLVFYQDLTLAEAAAVMRVTVGSTRQHYERGKARMRELLKNELYHET